MTALIEPIDRQPAYTIEDIIGDISGKFEPFAFYNEDGDCIEFFFSNDMHYGDRMNDYITVYRSMDTDEIVGSVIKNVKKFCREVLTKCPGFAVLTQGGTVRIQHLFLAYYLSQPYPPAVYKDIVDLAEKNRMNAVKIPRN